MKLKKFHNIIENTPEEVKEEIILSMEILKCINELLDKKFEGKQKLLAEKMNKTEAEISKWFSGVQNFTIKTLTKLQVAFGEPIISVITKESNSTFTQLKGPINIGNSTMHVLKGGVSSEKKSQYQKITNFNFKLMKGSNNVAI